VKKRSNIIKKYRKAFQIGMQSAMIYRIDFIMGIVSGIIPFAVQIFIWKAVYTTSNEESLRGFSYHFILFYILAAAMVAKLVSCLSHHQIAEEIKNGGVSKYLLKPVDHFFYYLMSEAGGRFFLIVFIDVGLVLIGGYFTGTIRVISSLIQLFVTLLAFVIHFLIYYLIALSAFWFSKATSIFTVFGLISSFLGGGIIPLDFFPNGMQNILNYLPFGLTIYFPVKMLLFEIPKGEKIFFISLQCIWIGLLFLICKLVWKKGLEKYSAYGG